MGRGQLYPNPLSLGNDRIEEPDHICPFLQKHIGHFCTGFASHSIMGAMAESPSINVKAGFLSPFLKIAGVGLSLSLDEVSLSNGWKTLMEPSMGRASELENKYGREHRRRISMTSFSPVMYPSMIPPCFADKTCRVAFIYHGQCIICPQGS